MSTIYIESFIPRDAFHQEEVAVMEAENRELEILDEGYESIAVPGGCCALGQNSAKIK
jgi:hypothetical protein